MLASHTHLAVRVREFIGSMAKRTEGASAVEYGLLVALIALVIIAAVGLVGSNLSGRFSSMATELN